MDYPTFLRNAERGQVAPLVLIHGADPQLLNDALATVTRALFSDPAAAVFDREIFDGREVDVETLVNAASTLPLQAARRLVALRHAQALVAKDAAVLGRYAAGPSATSCLLLLADEALGPARDRKPHWLLSAVPAAAVVELAPRRGRAIEEWLRQRATAEGLTVSEEAARLLVQLVGDDSAALLGEARKAALAGGGDNRMVGVTEVTAVVGEHRLSAIFELSRAIERGEVGLALRTLERLLATEDPMPILVSLTRDVRTTWTVREWRQAGQPVEQIARILRRPPPVVEALAGAAVAQSPRTLAWKLARCWQTEQRLKSGGEPHAEMAALVLELCSAR